MARTGKDPAYQHFKPRNLGMVCLDGKKHYLGIYNSPESKERYYRLLAEWHASKEQRAPRPPRRPDRITIKQLVDRFVRDRVTPYYRDEHGKPTGEAVNVHYALAPLLKLYGSTEVADFGPREFRLVRDEMVRSGQARSTVNRNAGRLRFLFRWAVSHDAYPADRLIALESIEGLRRGRTLAAEPDPIGPVDPAVLMATLPYLTAKQRAIVDLLLLTGARPGEICKLQPSHIADQAGPVWRAELARHKSTHRDKRRVIFFGPRAQAILAVWIQDCPLNRPVFAPESREPNKHGQLTNKPYSVAVLRNEIARACRKAKVAAWRPNQLRHSVATLVRRRFGLEASQVVLGHAKADTTQIYAERDFERARAIAEEIG